MSSSEMGEQGNPVLVRFQELRSELLGVTTRAQQLTADLGPFRQEIDSRLALIAAAIDASRLNLVVIGAEGNGKSTFINAITGLDVTPTDLQEPGTVAAVYLEWADVPEPVFSVLIDAPDGREQHRCSGRAEFAQFMLQATNPDNERRVLAGYVRLNHPLLRNGLRLVDMPGIEGVSMAVSQEASRFIHDEAHTVILVCRDRQYAPLARVADVLSNHPLRVDACVSNWSLDFWTDVDSLPEKVSRQQQLMPRKINDEGGSVEIVPEHVYVVHLPTVAGERTPTGARPVDNPVHEEQELALRDRVWQAVQQLGVDRVLLDGTGHAEVAFQAIDAHLRLRSDLLGALLDGADSGEIVEAVTAARAAADKQWLQWSDPDVVDAAAAATWRKLKPEVERARDTVFAKISALQERLRSGEDAHGRLSKGRARDIHNELNRCVGDSFGQLQDAQTDVLQLLANEYLHTANDAIDTVYRAVPTIREADSARYHIDADAIAALTVKLDDDPMGRIAKVGVAAGSAGVGGMLAGGQGVAVLAVGALAAAPFAAAVIGALGAGALGWAAVDFARGGQRSGAQDGLRRAAESVIAMETSPNGTLYELWRSVVHDVVSSIDGVLAHRLDAMVAVVQDPQAGAAALASERDSIRQSRDRLAELVAQLDSIGARARG